MDESHENTRGLADLTIARAQRPAGARRGWILLAGILTSAALLTAGAVWWYANTTGANIVSAVAQRPVEVNLLLIGGADEASESVALVATGRIVSDRRVMVATKVSGQIVDLLVEQGDTVEADQVLARIEDVVYRAQRDEAMAEVERCRFEHARARSELARARSTIVQMRADYEFELRNYERLEQLHATDQASDFEYFNAKNTFEAAQAAVEVAGAAAESASAAVLVAEAQLEAAGAFLEVAQKRLDDCAIRAPIGGVILQRNAQVGDFLAAEGGRGANANAQLVEIADMSLLRVEIDVSERDVHRLRTGQQARITPDADRSCTYDGRILWIDPVGDYAKATVQVKVRIDDPGPGLRVEGSAKVAFLARDPLATPSADATEAIWVPKASLKLTPGTDEALVFTVSSDRAVAHPVVIGARSDKSVEVRSGVQAGMKIIVGDLDHVDNGDAVKVMKTVTMEEL